MDPAAKQPDAAPRSRRGLGALGVGLGILALVALLWAVSRSAPERAGVTAADPWPRVGWEEVERSEELITRSRPGSSGWRSPSRTWRFPMAGVARSLPTSCASWISSSRPKRRA